MDLDVDEDAEFIRAVAAYRRNRKSEAVKSNGRSESPKEHVGEVQRNQRLKSSNKNIGNVQKMKFFEQLNTSASSDVQDLMSFFFTAKNTEQRTAEKQFSKYEKQGAIPKRSVLNPSSQKRASKPKTSQKDCLKENRIKNNNKKKESDDGIIRRDSSHNEIGSVGDAMVLSEKVCSKPFFYIVPERPAPNFLFSRGSYYVVPKIPDSSSSETVIIHPDACQPSETESASFLICDWEAKAGDVSKAEERTHPKNDLGKVEPQRVDSHLNIGPTEVSEAITDDNLESNCNGEKTYNKNVKLNPEESPEVSDARNEAASPSPGKTVERELLMMEFPDVDFSSVKLTEEDEYTDEERLEEYDAELQLERKIEKQARRMMEALPGSSYANLLMKCEEFEGDEEKVAAYIEETKLRKKHERLLEEMLSVLPDADASFLLEKIKTLSSSGDINALTAELLESQDYPKVAEGVWSPTKKLWQTYVEEFQVHSYLKEVPEPKKFEGPAGDNNKTNVGLILRFLKARYPTLSESTLSTRFYSNSRNVTKTCAGLSEFEVVRLSESDLGFENFSEEFLKEICYIDHKKEIDRHLEMLEEKKEVEVFEARLNGAFLECPLCGNDELIASEAVTCPEGDVFCGDCIRRYAETKISDGVYKFVCPEERCGSFFPISTLERLLPERVFSIVVQKQQAEEVTTADVDGLEFCPFCDFACIPNPNDRVFKCLNLVCLSETCRKCKEKSHIPLRCEEIERAPDVEARKKIEEAMSEKLIRKCPKCQKALLKIDGCNKISCTCGTLLCYVCRQEITGYDHFQNNRLVRVGCPLYSNNDDLHEVQVIRAGIEARNAVQQQNPGVRIIHDPVNTFSQK